jgi:RNA polymerase sigma factor (sigma-70 family)
MAGSPRDVETRVLVRRWALAEAEREALIRLARRKGLNEADAEDCVQEAIVKVVPRPELDEARIGALLATVVKRRAIDMHRRARSAARASQRLETIATQDVAGPDDALCDRDEAEWSARVVKGLPPLQRRVLVARAQGRSWNEIAAEMSTSVKAVESAVSRARAAVRVAIAATLGIGATLARRWRSTTTTALAGGGAAMALVAFTVPLLHHAPGPAEDATPGGAGRGSVRLATTASSATAAAATSSASGQHHGSGHGGNGGSGHGGSGDHRPSRTDTIASVESPVENAPIHRAWVTETHEDASHVDNVVSCVQNGYSLTVEPGDGVAVPDVQGHCNEPQRHS